MTRRYAAVLVTMSVLAPVRGGEPEATITIHDRVSNRITRFMTGACLEDVNHEVYGGIYSQMLYGESFQEPARPRANGDADVPGTAIRSPIVCDISSLATRSPSMRPTGGVSNLWRKPFGRGTPMSRSWSAISVAAGESRTPITSKELPASRAWRRTRRSWT
jgi:hypothetical protein